MIFLTLSNVTTVSENASERLARNLLKGLDALQAKSCDHCNSYGICGTQCGDIAIIQTLRQGIQQLASS